MPNQYHAQPRSLAGSALQAMRPAHQQWQTGANRMNLETYRTKRSSQSPRKTDTRRVFNNVMTQNSMGKYLPKAAAEPSASSPILYAIASCLPHTLLPAKNNTRRGHQERQAILDDFEKHCAAASTRWIYNDCGF